MIKWTRNYILSIQAEGGWLDITMPYTMSFSIVRNTMAQANTGRFTILNLAEDTRRRIYKDKYRTNVYKGIELRAGYGDTKETLPLIFKGNIMQAYSQRNGVNYETSIEAYDGGFAYVNANTARAFADGTPDKQILESLIQDLPHVTKGKIGEYLDKLPKGNTMNGPTAELIKNISKSNFFIDNEKAYCLQDNECIKGSIQKITSDTGLMGSPLREEALLTFTIMFEPRLQVGQYIQLESQTEKLFNGEYKVLGIEHQGVISDAQSGRCITKASLYYGAGGLKIL